MKILWERDNIELSLTLDEAMSASHAGQCEEDVASLYWKIEDQFESIPFESIVTYLLGYGAWTRKELEEDTILTKQRLLWIACGDIVEEYHEKV